MLLLLTFITPTNSKAATYKLQSLESIPQPSCYMHEFLRVVFFLPTVLEAVLIGIRLIKDRGS